VKASDRAPQPTLADLFAGFLSISLHAFGGALPWTRRELVEQRGWLTAEEFTDLLGLCQFLPGPNVGNLSMVVGLRLRGVRGAAAAFLGLYAVPIAIVICLGLLYRHYGELPRLHGALTGIAAAAAGLIAAMAWKMAAPLRTRPALRAWAVAGAAFVAIALLRWPLAWVMLGLAPLSIALARSDDA
jgi:chromate transporter